MKYERAPAWHTRPTMHKDIIAALWSALLYPLLVITTTNLFAGLSVHFGKYTLMGLGVASVIGFILNLILGIPASRWLIKRNKPYLRYYLIIGAVIGSILVSIIYLIETSAVSEALSLIGLGGLSGFWLSLFFWLVRRPDKDLPPGHPDTAIQGHPRFKLNLSKLDLAALLLPILFVLSMGAHHKIEKIKAKNAKKDAIEWVKALPAPQFDTLKGPAPLTVKMTLEPFGEIQSTSCDFSDPTIPIIYKHPRPPRPDLNKSVAWGDGVRTIYASEHTPYCIEPISHTYTTPGIYILEVLEAKHSQFNLFFGDEPAGIVEKRYTVVVE